MAPARLADYLRLPSRLPTGISPAPEAAFLPPGDPYEPDYFPRFADWASQEALAALTLAVPDAVCHVAFVRGSLAGDRLVQAETSWPEAVEVLNLEPALDGLRKAHGAAVTAALADRLRRALTGSLAGVDGKAGPAKPLYRIKAPDADLLTPENLADVRAFMADVAHLSDAVTNPIVVAMLHELRPKAKDLPVLAEEVERVFAGFGQPKLAGRWLAKHATLVEIMVAQRCYNPLVPVTTDCVERTAGLLGVDAEAARLALDLVRFAMLSVPFGKRKKVFSDAAVRSLSVVVQDDNLDLDALLAAACRAGERLAREEAVRNFRERFEHVKFSYRPAVLLIPAEVARVCRELGPAQWLDIAARHHAGLDSLAAGVRARTGVTVADAVLEKIVLLSGPHLGESGWKRIDLPTMDTARLQQLLDAAVEGPEEAFEDLVAACTEASAHPRSTNVRGYAEAPAGRMSVAAESLTRPG
jgi:hypothetical protein